MAVATKQCPKCKRALPPDCFHKSSRWGLASWCKDCYRSIANRAARAKRSGGSCRCGRPPRPGKASCEPCAATQRANSRRRWADSGRREAAKAQNRQAYERLKQLIFDAYGHTCQCCDEHRKEFLTIDHMEPAGSRRHKTRCGVGLYRWLKKSGFPPGYRTLCLNCNFSIGHFGYCPHSRE